jgi:hypothetical protein
VRGQLQGDLRRHNAFAGADPTDRVDQLGAHEVLEKIAGGTRLEGPLAKAIDPLTLDPLVCADTLTPAICATIALSLALIGPGAFSLDARLFGRRILTSSED